MVKEEDTGCLPQNRKSDPDYDPTGSAVKTEEVGEYCPRQTIDCITQKTKKSFCIDALLARNESKNLDGYGLREARNDPGRIFRQGKEDLPRNKFFLDALENCAQKSRLFDAYNLTPKPEDRGGTDGEYEELPAKLKVIRSFENSYAKSKMEDADSKSDVYQTQDDIGRYSPEFENRGRDYENSRSVTPYSVKSNDTRSNSPDQSEMSSPPISPGNENDFVSKKNGDEFQERQMFSRPGLLVSNGPQTFLGQNPMVGSRSNISHLGPHPAFLAYSNPHSFSSAFHPLNPGSPKMTNSNNPGLKHGLNVNPNAGGAILGLNASGTQHLHHMQLEWLARTGMFYPRLPELAAGIGRKVQPGKSAGFSGYPISSRFGIALSPRSIRPALFPSPLTLPPLITDLSSAVPPGGRKTIPKRKMKQDNAEGRTTLK
ncbi:UNVERIFIED_CONTAM: hypothetical protein PYX00_010085 [Menopon gallinae]|uniref:Uncharacterized protein n=1 Tax=Menopon gallinae TaxID=328185 RepID=A0AAW2HDN2_9NEOP